MPILSPSLWIAFVALLGLIVGSFLNVVILRLPPRLEALWRREAREQLGVAAESSPLPPGIVREPSHCPSCRQRLTARDLVPVLSWCLLRGRCRHCRVPISIQYPLLELITAALSALVALRFAPSVAALAALFFCWTLIALAGIDVRTRLLPDPLTLPLLWLGLAGSLVPLWVAPAQAILGAGLGYLCLWSVYWAFRLLTGKDGLGHGDFKLLAALGAWLGAEALLPIILSASLLGLAYGLISAARGRLQRDSPFPFGPFLAVAGISWLLAGAKLSRLFFAWSVGG